MSNNTLDLIISAILLVIVCGGVVTLIFVIADLLVKSAYKEK